MNLIKNKKFTGAVAGVLAGVMLMSGALALQGSNSIINRFFGASDEPFVPPTIEENWDPGAMGTKEITVKNTGDAIVYARVNLGEYLDITAPIPTNATEAGTHSFATNMPTNADAEASRATTFGTDFEWTFDNMMTYNEYVVAKALADADGITMPATWVYAADGWAYWTAPIMPNTETDVFLAAVNYAAGGTLSDTDDYYYAIKAGFEWVSQEDVGIWAGATTTPAQPTEPGQLPVQAAAHTTIRPIFSNFYLNPPALPGEEFAPDFTIGGTEYAQVSKSDGNANDRILEDEDGNLFYYKGTDMSALENGTASASDLMDVVTYPIGTIDFAPLPPFDPALYPTTTYWLYHGSGGVFIPIYDNGVNYLQAVVQGPLPGLADGDEARAAVPTAQQLPVAQRVPA